MAKYTKTTLLPEENILYSTKPHYIVFGKFFVYLVLAYFVGFHFLDSLLIGAVLVIASIAAFVNSIVVYFCSEYVITNKRILVKIGFIQRKSLEIFLNRVEGVYIDQSILGRVLNYGTVVVAGIGGTKNPFYYIPNPLSFRSNIQEQLQKIEAK
jgi:uncharacterized membrane protein YdbT with pleckstrin-like domain